MKFTVKLPLSVTLRQIFHKTVLTIRERTADMVIGIHQSIRVMDCKAIVNPIAHIAMRTIKVIMTALNIGENPL
ncbi:MAG: hypothetical protein K2N05_12915 [Muribaculaceae bacterium]|nr:hypothetical protein [Muribaculaceae bacterium]